MLHKTRGIVLKTTLYSESSVVVQMFTEKFGMQSYLINGVKKPRAKIRMNMLQPLHLVDMVVYHKVNSSIQRISELRPAPIFRNIPYDILKSTMAMFLNEVLYKSIRQQMTDEYLFDFIFNAVCWFDESQGSNVNFHLAFLLKLSRYLGFAPSTQTKSDQSYFDLQEGEFKSLPPVHPYFIDKEDASLFISLYILPFEKIIEIKLANKTRRRILDKILIYYTLHTASFGEIRSHQVLEDILS
ncbi:DNA repair protein RecO [Pedobacter gandavensis]|uniref:DNA repair protein RecO n=1 Tax=Pedobacter gandavensis TaxID=2679963 RepID=A0ABR6EWM5_9SPHI|nr:DNA repair protein RecO [Pedobacter gandavensis]MBB2149685.1 DNA repair protein RecO [Pedobacter gandavensis]